jgi:arabinoxylan arabinofuranohydrolase
MECKDGVYVSGIHDGDYIKVREVDFEDLSPKCLCVSVASALRGGTLEVRTDSISGPLIAELTIPSTGGWECWKTLQTDIVKPVTGIQDIYFVFKGRKGCKLFNFDWYKFNR